MYRLGLCCIFRETPIAFRTSTAANLAKYNRTDVLARIGEIALHNVLSVGQAVAYCRDHQIGAFRVQSQLLPLRTHPTVGYALDDLPNAGELRAQMERVRQLARTSDVRLTFHPDQFIVLNSLRADVVEKSIEDLEHHGEVAELLGADVINIHAGGAFGDKDAALHRLETNLRRLSPRVLERLTLENDDVTYTPSDLLPVCWRQGIPMVYDVHHHRVLSDGATVAEATEMAISTWLPRRPEYGPVFHLSSPINGWDGKMLRSHHEYIDPADFPREWEGLAVTIEVEAKAKELAIARLQADLGWGVMRKTG